MKKHEPKCIQVYTLSDGLDLCGGNQTLLAKELGISRTTLRSHLDCGGHQLLEVIDGDGDSFGLRYINKGWTK